MKRNHVAAVAAVGLSFVLLAAVPASANIPVSASSGSSAELVRLADSGPTWGTAEQVPGTATLNAGKSAIVYSVSCASAGNCSAGGFYSDASERAQAFVVNESNGTWATAQEVPGSARLNAGGVAEVLSVSCASAGNCSAGGFYSGSSFRGHAFVVNESNGTWGTMKRVHGTATAHVRSAEVQSVSCASAGNCSAGGFSTDASGDTQAFVVNETGRTWHTAEEVPGLAGLNAAATQVESVSCASSGNCSAVGGYTDASGNSQAFVVNETNGTWLAAEEVPGLARLNADGYAGVQSISCGAAGTCSAGGQYRDASGNYQAFVVNETNGTWRTAEEVPGSARLNAKGGAGISSVSCASPGNCSAGGSYLDASFNAQAFVVNETDGRWGTALEVPGFGALNAGGGVNNGVYSVSCASAGNCSAGGPYVEASFKSQAFVADEISGIWHTAQEVPGLARLNAAGQAYVASVSCGAPGNCSAGGSYERASRRFGNFQAFVVNETNGS